jgi:hypothetical protein
MEQQQRRARDQSLREASATIGGTSTIKGMEEYLVLLSISETGKAKGADTLDLFLADNAGSLLAHT